MELFSLKNYQLFAGGVLLLVIGYVFLGMGPVQNPLSKTLAPLVLVGTYCVYFPWAILTAVKGSEEESGENKKGV